MNLNLFDWWRQRRALPRDEHGRVRSGSVREGGEGLLHPKQMTASEKIISLMQANVHRWTPEQNKRLTTQIEALRAQVIKEERRGSADA